MSGADKNEEVVMNIKNPAALSALAKGDIGNFLVASTLGGIERQEAEGQAALIATTNMPKEMRPSREAFEAIGFTFGEPVDEIFLSATLPPGWKREASDHSMWSYIRDEYGRKRVAVFYKAAFYDRRADASLETRYGPARKYPESGSDAPIIFGISDCGEMIWTAGEAPCEYDRDVEQKLNAAVTAYLKEHYPNWADPTAYWERP